MPENDVVAARIRRLREGRDLSRRQVAEALKVDVAAVSGWESGRYLPRVGHRGCLAALLGAAPENLFDAAPDAGGAENVSVSLVDTLSDLAPLLVRLAGQCRRLRALRIAAPYATPAHVQQAFRSIVSRRLLAGELEVQRVEIVYSLERLKEIAANILRYDGKPYHVKAYCAGLAEVAPAMGGYFFDDTDFLIGAYWTGVPPHDRPGLRLSGEPFRGYFKEYWDEIWRRGTLLNLRGAHDLSAVRVVALKMGLAAKAWPGFVEAARTLEIGDGAPPLV